MLLFLSEVHRCFIDFVESSWDLDGSEIFFRDVVWNSSRNCQIWNMLECLKITGKNPTRFWIFHWGEAGDSEILQVASWHIGHGG
jgi:hypothetical protein